MDPELHRIYKYLKKAKKAITIENSDLFIMKNGKECAALYDQLFPHIFKEFRIIDYFGNIGWVSFTLK